MLSRSLWGGSLVKRSLHDDRGGRFTAAVDADLGADFGHRRRHVAEPDALAESRRGRAARADPDRGPVRVEQRVAVPSHAAPGHLEADEFASEAVFLDVDERLLAEEVGLVELHDPGEPGFERIRGLVDVV